jgi:hypothetical protein
MVVPNTPTTTAAVLASGVNLGHSVRNATSPHGTCTVNRTAAYASRETVRHFRKKT